MVVARHPPRTPPKIETMKSHRVLTPLLLASLTLSLTSCAAMFRGTQDEVFFQAKPEGSQVRVGETTYPLPAQLTIPRKTQSVTFVHPEYGEQEVKLESSGSGGYVLMDILFTPGFGLLGLLIDGSTGSLRDLPPMVSMDFPAGVADQTENQGASEVASAPAAQATSDSFASE